MVQPLLDIFCSALLQSFGIYFSFVPMTHSFQEQHHRISEPLPVLYNWLVVYLYFLLLLLHSTHLAFVWLVAPPPPPCVPSHSTYSAYLGQRLVREEAAKVRHNGVRLGAEVNVLGNRAVAKGVLQVVRVDARAVRNAHDIVGRRHGNHSLGLCRWLQKGEEKAVSWYSNLAVVFSVGAWVLASVALLFVLRL